MVDLLHRTTGLEAFDADTQRQLFRAVRRGLSGRRQARKRSMSLVAVEIEAACIEPLTTRQIADKLGRKHTGYLIKHYLAPMVADGRLVQIDELYSTPPKTGRILP